MRKPRWEYLALPTAFTLLVTVWLLSIPDAARTSTVAEETPVPTEMLEVPSPTEVETEPQPQGAILDVEIEPAEVIEPPVHPVRIQVHFLNESDIPARPLLTWTILNREGHVIDQGRQADTVVSPGLEETLTIAWDHAGQPVGDYTAHLTTTLDETLVDERDAGFQLLQEGTLTPKGELVELRFEGAVIPSAAGEIVAVFHNTGNFDVVASLSVEIYRDAEIMALVTSDPQPSTSGETTLIRAPFQFPDTGIYRMAGMVRYAEKETGVQEAQFEVTAPDEVPPPPEAAATAEPTPTAIPPEPTAEPTEEPASTPTPEVSYEPDPTSTPVHTIEPAPTPTASPTATPAPTNTPTPTPSPAPDPSPSRTPVESTLPTPTATPTATPESPPATATPPESGMKEPAPPATTAPLPTPAPAETPTAFQPKPQAPAETPEETPQATATPVPPTPATATPSETSTEGPVTTREPTATTSEPSQEPAPAEPGAPSDPLTPLKIVAAWQLPDMQPEIDGLQYGTQTDPGQHDDDTLQPGIQAAPNLGDAPGKRQVELWAVVDAPHGAGGVANVAFHVYRPDGSTHQQVVASVVNCQVLDQPRIAGSPVGAAVDSEQLTASAGEAAASCASTDRVVYRAIAELGIADPPGMYRVETLVHSSDGESRASYQGFDVLPVMGLSVNVDVVDFGSVRPGEWQQASTVYSVRNTGNRAGHVAIKFGAMVGAETGATIAGFGAELGGDQIMAIVPNTTACFSVPLLPGESRDLRLLIQPGQLPADRYSGQLAFNLRASCAS